MDIPEEGKRDSIITISTGAANSRPGKGPNMIKEGSKIKVHIYDVNKKEIKTRAHDRVFTVRNCGGVLGIDWTADQFTPLAAFATDNGAVIFEGVTV